MTLPPIGTAVVDADVYRDPLRYELEVANVLRASWLVAARSSELPGPGDWILYEGHGDTVVVSRQADGSVAAFHNVCQHRGVRLTRGETSGCTRRFTCPYHGWVWINLAGPQAAPPLLDWIGADITTDLGRFAMEGMILHEKLVFDLDVNYKCVVDGFNEVYHATELHHTAPEFTKSSRDTAFHLSGPNSMMFVPRPDHLDKLAETGDHHRYTICHYVVFPNTVFNNNPDQIQVFNPIPISVDRTRFICWELIYAPAEGEAPADYERYHSATMARWEQLQKVVGEDVFVYRELSATRNSMGYRQNLFGAKECKPTEYHRTMDHCVAGGSPMDRWADHPVGGQR